MWVLPFLINFLVLEENVSNMKNHLFKLNLVIVIRKYSFKVMWVFNSLYFAMGM